MESFLLLLLLLHLSLWLLKERNKNAKQLNLPPSPPSLPITGNLHLLCTLPYRSTVELAKKIWPSCSYTLALLQQCSSHHPRGREREVLKNQDAQMCKRIHLQGPRKVSYDFRDIAFTPYSEWWREVRKICNLELRSPKAVQSYMFVREEEIFRFMNSLAEAASNLIDLSEKLFNLTDAMICRIAFGKTYKSRGFDSGRFAQAIQEAKTAMSNFAASDFFPYFGWIIDSRISISKEHIKGVLKDVFVGAIDTSALTMTWTMTELARHPKLLNKVQDEIRSYIRSKGKVEKSDSESSLLQSSSEGVMEVASTSSTFDC